LKRLLEQCRQSAGRMKPVQMNEKEKHSSVVVHQKRGKHKERERERRGPIPGGGGGGGDN
jgi:hypothetical protein